MGGEPFVGDATQEDAADRAQHAVDVRQELVVHDVPVEFLIRSVEVSVHRDEELQEEPPHEWSPFKRAASDSRRDRVPSSLWVTVSWSSRNTPCSVRTRRVAASSRQNWIVATDTEIRSSSAYISYV